MVSVMGVILVLIVGMMLFVGVGSKKLSYAKIEEKIISAGQKYYEDNSDKLPDAGTKSINVSTLVSEGYMNDLSKYTKKDVSCTGNLYVTKNPSGHSYRAKLDCGKSYTTKKLSSVITKDVVTSGSGLYEEEQADPNNIGATHKVYVFKGDNVKNYVKIGDFYWQIVKVYENGEIEVLGDPELLRRLWDNRYNIEAAKYNGINDYSVSRMRDYISDDVVGATDSFLKIKSFITTHTACIGKRTLDDVSKDGSTECSEVLADQFFSLLPVYDYMNASLDENCNKALDDSCYNYNYLTKLNDEWWTITGVADNTQDVYFIDSVLETSYASLTKSVRMLAHLDSNVMYVSGDGTYDDPYIIK